ncbi:MAG: hypothetical protein IKX97_05265 [Erysipelotrichaceae bacterium]|nr:hypothetical protein [Erysipelotrichaceae bacterium]MBR5755209.1 hypothetical protein [Erysipelotrichaceae bacterium]
MRLSELIRQDREQFADLPDRRSRFNFIWDYYKIPIIALLSFLVLSLIIISTNLRRADVSLYAVLLNNDSLAVECDDTVFDRLLEESGLELKGKKADINASYSLGRELKENEDAETLQVLSAMFAMDDIDIFVADREHFDYFARTDAFCDLNALIPEELLKNDLYAYEDSRGNTVAGGIILHEGSPLHEAGYYHSDVVLGIAVNCGNIEAARAAVMQILSDTN